VSNVDFYITYIGMPVSITLVLIMYFFRRKGSFTSILGKVVYFVSFLLAGGVLGLAMQINEGNIFVLSCSVIAILFLVFVYNAPIRKHKSDWR
jgi:uncharacterized membrane protein